MSDPLLQVDLLKVPGAVRPVVGVAGYIYRANRLDRLSTEFDAGRIEAADARTRANANLVRVARRSRDLMGVGALMLGLAAASKVMGETLSAPAWALATLAPALIFCAKSWFEATHLKAVDVEAERVRTELAVVEARHNWLERTARVVPVLQQAIGYSTLALVADDVATANDSLKRAMAAERKLRARLASPRYRNLALGHGGWGAVSDGARRALTAGIIAAGVNCVAFAGFGRLAPTVVCGVAASVVAAIRYGVSYSVVQRRSQAVARLGVWNKQRDMLADVDKVVRNHVDALVELYQRKVVVDLRNLN